MYGFFGLLSGVLPMLGVFPYVKDILKHQTKPHRGSFLIWVILGGIAFFTQLAKGATWSLFLPASDTTATFIIFILAIRYGVGGLNRRDVTGLVLAGAGLILWYFTKDPLIALLIAISVDAVGTVFTLIKTWEDPDSETLSSWLLATLGGLFAALAVGKFSFSLLVYPIYIFIANGAIDAVILLKRESVSLPKIRR